MDIAIIGAGNVGKALGAGWAKAGHRVVYGVRKPDFGDRMPVPEAVAQSDVVVLCVPWSAAQDAVQSAGSLSGKVLIDATNPLKPDLSGLELGTTTSAAEKIQGWAPAASVVKAFNTIGFNVMENTTFPEGKPLLLYCGDEDGAKQVVHQLAEDLGFDPQDAGPLSQARLLEPFAMLWISLAYQVGLGREIAFKLMKR